MGSARIMIVEDSTTVAGDLRDCLEGLGYGVTAIVASGEESIEKADADPTKAFQPARDACRDVPMQSTTRRQERRGPAASGPASASILRFTVPPTRETRANPETGGN